MNEVFRFENAPPVRVMIVSSQSGSECHQVVILEEETARLVFCESYETLEEAQEEAVCSVRSHLMKVVRDLYDEAERFTLTPK